MTLTVGAELEKLLLRARSASHDLVESPRNEALTVIAAELLRQADGIIAANALDLAAGEREGAPAALLDRLRLDHARVKGMAAGVLQVVQQPDPVGRILDGWQLQNGLRVSQVTVPFGVIGMIYESRPNVTVDAAVLALKAGSAVVLRGSAGALNSNRFLTRVIQDALQTAGVPVYAVQLIDSPDRAAVTQLVAARGFVDLVIPRGGPGLISHVVETARVPVIETGSGNCHIYVAAAAHLADAHAITLNAKLQRPGVCNAVETLLVHESVSEAFLPRVAKELTAAGVSLRGCELTVSQLPAGLAAAASPADWDEEFLGPVLAVRIVASDADAVEHIRRHGSGHSEAIVTQDTAAASHFQGAVDAAVVYVNASTRFTDGFEFGFGAELGISTQKLHARGPLGLAQLVTSKYLVEGSGQVRS